MTAFNLVVETLVSAMISVRCLLGNRLHVAAQFICNDDLWIAELCDQPCHEAFGRFRISAGLDKNVARIAVGVDCTPEPMLHTVDWDHNSRRGANYRSVVAGHDEYTQRNALQTD